MKRKFYFVPRMANFCREDVIFTIFVGSGKRDAVKLALIQEYAADSGMYFKPVSDSSDTAIRNLKEQVFKGIPFFLCPCKSVSLTIGQLYNLIIDGQLDSFCSKIPLPHGYFLFRKKIDPSFYFATKAKRSRRLLLPFPRKNLKQMEDAPMVSFLINSALIVVAFLIAGYIEGHYGY